MPNSDIVKEYYEVLDVLEDRTGCHNIDIVSGNRRLYYDFKNSRKALDSGDVPVWVVVEKIKYKRFDKKIGEYGSLSLALKALTNK